VDAAVAEMYRCVNELGMIGIAVAPNIPIPHPKAPEAFPDVQQVTISHPDFEPLCTSCRRLDIAIGVHGGPGSYMVFLDYTETLSLPIFRTEPATVALARMVFDGAFERFPTPGRLLKVVVVAGSCPCLS